MFGIHTSSKNNNKEFQESGISIILTKLGIYVWFTLYCSCFHFIFDNQWKLEQAGAELCQAQFKFG